MGNIQQISNCTVLFLLCKLVRD